MLPHVPSQDTKFSLSLQELTSCKNTGFAPEKQVWYQSTKHQPFENEGYNAISLRFHTAFDTILFQ